MMCLYLKIQKEFIYLIFGGRIPACAYNICSYGQIIIIIIIIIASFSKQRLLVVFLCSFNDGQSPHIPRALFNILTDLNNPIVGMVSVSFSYFNFY